MYGTMGKLGVKFADEVATASISKFRSLGKTGKPKTNAEWTLLACFLKLEHDGEALEVVALGTGSKCIGENHMPSAGDVLHDSHAEVIARRAFVLYLLSQVERSTRGEVSVFEQKGDKFALKPGIGFHFYASHTPCGDASIFPMQRWVECYGEVAEAASGGELSENATECRPEVDPPTLRSRECNEVNSTEPPLKKSKTDKVDQSMQKSSSRLNCNDSDDCLSSTIGTNRSEETCKSSSFNVLKHEVAHTEDCADQSLNENVAVRPDIHRTGAKCVTGEKADPKMPGCDYHVTGPLRTKPGRGDRTLSMSCSDKIFKWTALGVQGALLMLFLETPLYVESITIGKCPYSQEAMERALFGRFEDKLRYIQLPDGFHIVKPSILHSDIEFPFSRSCASSDTSEASKVIPTPTSLIWSSSDTHKDKHEVATKGLRLGTTRTNRGTRQSWVSICRQAILQRVLTLLLEKGKDTIEDRKVSSLSYEEMKCQSHSYNKAWHSLKMHVLINWTVKPDNIKRFIAMDAS